MFAVFTLVNFDFNPKTKFIGFWLSKIQNGLYLLRMTKNAVRAITLNDLRCDVPKEEKNTIYEDQNQQNIYTVTKTKI